MGKSVRYEFWRLTIHQQFSMLSDNNLDESQFETLRAGLIKKAIFEKPMFQLRRGSYWVIDNIDCSTDGCFLSFKVGRIKSGDMPVHTGIGFKDESINYAPNTDILVDLNRCLICIRPKSSLIKNVAGVASAIQNLLNKTDVAKEYRFYFSLKAIPDNRIFMERFRNSARVRKVSLMILRPNPKDDNEDFVKSLSAAMENAKATKASFEIDGDSLDKEMIQDAILSTNARGAKVKATIENEDGTKDEISDSGSTFSLSLDFSFSIDEIAGRVRGFYDRIRNGRA